VAEYSNQASVEAVREGDTVTIVCKGALDLHNCQDFREMLMAESAAAEEVIVDFLAVDYIDTAVLADLARAANKMIARGKRLKVKVSEPSHPLRTLQITGFSAVMDVLPSPKE